jgi:hypothetical protein
MAQPCARTELVLVTESTYPVVDPSMVTERQPSIGFVNP